MHIKHTDGDGIRKMDDEDLVMCDAVTMLCGLTWTCQYMLWSADEHETRRIQPAEIASGDMIHPVYIESDDMIEPRAFCEWACECVSLRFVL